MIGENGFTASSHMSAAERIAQAALYLAAGATVDEIPGIVDRMRGRLIAPGISGVAQQAVDAVAEYRASQHR